MTLQKERKRDKFLCCPRDNGKVNTANALLASVVFAGVHIHLQHLCQASAPHSVRLSFLLGATPATALRFEIQVTLVKDLTPGGTTSQSAEGKTLSFMSSLRAYCQHLGKLGK